MKKLLVLISLFTLVISFSAFAGGDSEENTGMSANKIAALFPGSIQDADYNTLGYIALQEVANSESLKSSYSEKIAVPDAERVMKEYINADFNIIFVHGNQFNGAVAKVAPEYPNVTFIIEIDAKPETLAPNVWYIGRNYYTGFYVLGALASMKTETGKIGFIGGLELPFIRGEVNAVNQALSDMDSDASLQYLFVGDFNDPLKARQAAEGLISQGVDIIISAVNLGNFGLYSAVKEAGRPVFLTTTYTDKATQAPENYLSSDIFNFSIPLKEIVANIVAGEKSGFLNMEYGEGMARSTQFPIMNVSDSVNAAVKQISEDVASGKIKVDMVLDKVLQ
ncbi:MAG: BMP family protein [Spirochaetia bacterium]|jgi:basic membrane protein A|nr:BMP family protein [Spirochaetia bacterium]